MGHRDPHAGQVRAEMANILVVDDEPTIRSLLRATFGSDHRVAEAADGAEALRCLLAYRPDLAILDVALPIMDGLAVCRAIRAEPSLAGLGIIVLSAYASGEAALAAGADRHLRKPFSPLELLATIEEVLAPRRAERPSTRPHAEHPPRTVAATDPPPGDRPRSSAVAAERSRRTGPCAP